MLTIDGKESCFDIELMRLICGDLGLARRPVDYTGTDFDVIFGDLGSGSYDAGISGPRLRPSGWPYSPTLTWSPNRGSS